LTAKSFQLIVVFLCLVLSLVATLASYNLYYTDSRIVDASLVYRGWPLYWVVELWSWWSPPQYPHTFQFQPLNFLIDIVFWAVVFQLPSATLLLLKEAKKHDGVEFFKKANSSPVL
jgi:hypothetical protein